MAKTAILAIQIISDATKAARELDKTSQSVSKMGKASAAAGKLLAVGLVGAGAAAVKFGNQASDLAETQSKVNQIFGEKGSAALDKFASTAAVKLGQSKQAALDAAATFGTLGSAAGLQGKNLAGFSSGLTKLASDMASFSNTSPTEAVEALAAGLRGEAEPLRKYGVLLNDATLKAKALELGLIQTTTQALTPQQKVLASQAVILEQTKKAQGDFARTSDGLANKQRILKARFTDFTTQLGSAALPALLAITSAGLAAVAWVDKHRATTAILVGVIVAFAAAVAAVNVAVKIYTATTAAWSAVTAAAAAIQTAFASASIGTRIALAALAVQTAVVAAATKAWAVVQAAFNLVMTANPIGIVIVAIAALVAGIILAYKNSATFRAIVQAVGKAAAAAFGWIVDKVKDVAKWIGENVPAAFGKFRDIALKVIDIVTAPWQLWFDVIKKIAGFLVDKLPAAFQTFKGIAETVGKAILAPFQAIADLIEKIIGAIKKIKIPNIPNPLGFLGRAATTTGGVAVAGGDTFVFNVPQGFIGDPDEITAVLTRAFDRRARRTAS